MIIWLNDIPDHKKQALLTWVKAEHTDFPSTVYVHDMTNTYAYCSSPMVSMVFWIDAEGISRIKPPDVAPKRWYVRDFLDHDGSTVALDLDYVQRVLDNDDWSVISEVELEQDSELESDAPFESTELEPLVDATETVKPAEPNEPEQDLEESVPVLVMASLVKPNIPPTPTMSRTTSSSALPKPLIHSSSTSSFRTFSGQKGVPTPIHQRPKWK